MHGLAHREPQVAAELAGGMEAAELFGGEIARAHQGDGQRVAQGQGGDGAGSGRQVVGIGLALYGGVQKHVDF